MTGRLDDRELFLEKELEAAPEAQTEYHSLDAREQSSRIS